MKEKEYVIGVDFGTDSVRSIIVDTANGEERSSAVHVFPRWKKGMFCDPAENRFRQHPLDHIEGLVKTVAEALAKALKGTAGKVRGLSIDTTGSTPVAVDRSGRPLALTPGFEKNPNAMFMLWKDHTAVAEAEEINRWARSWGGTDYTKYEGGVYSSEWFWAKILHVLRHDGKVRNAAFSWVENCDWIPALLSGNTDPLSIRRSRCAAGHKAMWHESFGGLPSEEFLVRLDPLLAGLRGRLYTETETSDRPAGVLSPEWSSRLGLPATVRVGIGAFDAHMGAVGGGITPYTMTKIMGTSTCDVIVAPMDEMGGRLVGGICGQVDGSVIPGMLGMEAGQSAFGDIYAWFKSVLMWPVENITGKSTLVDESARTLLVEEVSDRLIEELSRQAEKLPVEETGVLAIDWMNGRRTPDANQLLKGAVSGLSLGTGAPRIFRALVEATAFGAKAIADRFRREGVPINGVIALGGVAKKSPFIMQIVADVMNVPIRVPRSEQTCALGAAMFAAVVAGLYPTLADSMKAMESGWEREYTPRAEHARMYAGLYERYSSLARFVEDETMAPRRMQ
jgi:L-ribulokinase